MTGVVINMDTPDRSSLGFAESVKKAFKFICDLGFSEVETSSTLVRYQKNDVEVDIYHGRQSYEIGAGVTAFGVRYTVSEIIRHADPEFAKKYRYASTSTSEGVAVAVKELSLTMERYCCLALEGDERLFSALESERKLWTEDYALDVLVGQLRPKADDAFRKKDYSKAAELYSRIREKLTPAEIKKLNIAEERSKS